MLKPNNIDKEPQLNFQQNDYVYIERSSGETQAWIITNITEENKFITKPTIHSNMYRDYSFEELQSLNPDGPIDHQTFQLLEQSWYYCYNKHSLEDIFVNQSINQHEYIKNISILINNIEITQKNKKKSPILRKLQTRLNNIKTELEKTISIEKITTNNILELYPNGITNDLEQGTIGTCYLLSALKAIKLHPYLMRTLIQKSIVKKDEKTWIVTFIGDDYNIGPIEVSKDKLKRWKTHSGLRADDGDIILELAYASYVSRSKGREKKTMFTEDSGKFSVEGGHSHRTLADLLGPIGIKYRTTPNKSPYEFRTFANANDHASISNFFNNSYIKNKNNLITTASSVSSNYGDTDFEWVEGTKIYKSHAYTIIDFNPNTQKIAISNPHDSKKTFELSINGFNQIFYDLKFNKINRLALLTSKIEHIRSESICREIIQKKLNTTEIYQLTESLFNNVDHLYDNLTYTFEEIKNPVLKKVFQEEVNIALNNQNIAARI